MIDRFRDFLGVFSVVLFPSGLLFWFIIHPWARTWRKLGAALSYPIILAPVIALGLISYHYRIWLLGADLGMHWSLLVIVGLLWVTTTVIEAITWRELNIATLVGVPEVSTAERSKGKLLRDGAYRVVRHPRYANAAVGVIANALLINHVGLYIMLAVVFPLGMVMLWFEERDLVDRFGDEYRQYQRDVPQLRRPNRGIS